jgi:hypothetical protein
MVQQEWITNNPNATAAQFLKMLASRYQKLDLLVRFPKGF